MEIILQYFFIYNKKNGDIIFSFDFNLFDDS